MCEMVLSSTAGLTTGVYDGLAAFGELLSVAPRCEYSYSQLVFELSKRKLSSILTTSTPGVVIAIKNRSKNDATGLKHAGVHSRAHHALLGVRFEALV